MKRPFDEASKMAHKKLEPLYQVLSETESRPAGQNHPETERCGFDRNASHTEGCYVCTCGWSENDAPLRSSESKAGQAEQVQELLTKWWHGEMDNAEYFNRMGMLLKRASQDERPAPGMKLDEWRPIETAPKGRKVIAGYWNALGKWRTITARYYTPETLDSEHTQSGFASEGWYEESESIEEIMPTDCEPSHWMPLPNPPTVPSAEKGE